MKEQEMGYKRLKIYAGLVTAAAVLASAAFLAVFFHGGYDTKILVKLGLKEREPEVNQAARQAVSSWTHTLEKMDYDSEIVFFGDSITEGSDFREYFPDRRIVNLGYSGDMLTGMIDRVPMVRAVSPEKVFLLGGINGLHDTNVEECAANYAVLLDKLREAVPEAEIYAQSVLPMSAEKEEEFCHNTAIQELNEQIKALAGERGMIYVDLYSLYEADGVMNPELTTDGVHLRPEAYERWAEAIREYVD